MKKKYRLQANVVLWRVLSFLQKPALSRFASTLVVIGNLIFRHVNQGKQLTANQGREDELVKGQASE